MIELSESRAVPLSAEPIPSRSAHRKVAAVIALVIFGGIREPRARHSGSVRPGTDKCAELARRAGVNRTTISGIVQPLIDKTCLSKPSPARSKRSGGKPGRPLWFSPSARPICGVLLMPDAVQACLVTLDGAIIGENRVALPKGDGPVAPDHRSYQEVNASALAAATRKPLGVGVAVGGDGRYRPRLDRRDEISRRRSMDIRSPTNSGANSICRCVSIITLARCWSEIAGSARVEEQRNLR